MIVINEVFASHTGTDDTEFIELYGTPGTSLAGYSLIAIEGDSTAGPGTIDFRIDFGPEDVIGGNGFFLVGNPTGLANNYGVTPDETLATNSLENSSLTLALVETSSLSGGTGTLVTGNEVVVDTVALTDGGTTDSFYFGAPVIGPDGTFFPAGARRVTDGGDTESATDWVIGDFNLGTANTPTSSTTDTGNGGGDPELTPIYEIQGATHTSPLVGQSVTTTGVVTVVDTNGFYLQDPTGDGNEATSDAIFVFTGSAPTVVVGDAVQVTGTVSEFIPGGADTGNLSITQISGSPTVTVQSSGNSIPVPVLIGANGRAVPTGEIDDDGFATFDPATDAIDFFESLEGMLVTVDDPVAVGGTTGFSEIYTVTDGGAGAGDVSDRGTVNIGPGDFNPERVQIDNDSFTPGEIPQVDTGAQLNDVTGVVSYSFGNYEVLATQAVTVAEPSTLTPETTAITGDKNTLTVASYNVLNLDPNDNDGDMDIADGRFDAIADDIVNNLNSPDIIALQEVQDNSGAVDDGVVSADQTAQLLIDAIAAAGGPTYVYVDVPPADGTSGGQPGGNIRTGFLYNPERVDLVAVEAVTDPDLSDGDAFEDSRTPLSATFEFNGEEVTVVNNHSSSKGGSSPLFGQTQPSTDLQEDPAVNGGVDARNAQAQVVNDYVDTQLATDPDANIVVLGDMNEFEFISPLETLAGTNDPTGPVLTNLTNTLPEDERYSYIFEGNSQSLDHILVSDSLLNQVAFDIVHINAEFADTEQRASDHDPLVVGLYIPAPLFLTGGNGRDILTGGDGNDVINGRNGKDTLLGGDGDDTLIGGNGRDELNGGLGDDVLTGGNSNDTFVLAAGEGTDVITDFSVGNDLIGLADGLSFNDLTLVGNEIRFGDETLAILSGVNTASLTSTSFVTV